MYPQRDVEVIAELPPDAEYWVPKPRDIDEEGFAYFRDVWPLGQVRTRDAAALIAWERAAARLVSEASEDEPSFESLAEAVESFSPDADDLDQEIPGDLPEGPGLGGLELGVSGVAHALANAGFHPAASCRSHHERSWSDRPVVLFASDQQRLFLLLPLVANAGCGLLADATRGVPLFAVYSRSIVELMDLTSLLFASRALFRALPKTSRKRSPRPKPALPSHPEQSTLF